MKKPLLYIASCLLFLLCNIIFGQTRSEIGFNSGDSITQITSSEKVIIKGDTKIFIKSGTIVSNLEDFENSQNVVIIPDTSEKAIAKSNGNQSSKSKPSKKSPTKEKISSEKTETIE